MGLNAGSLKRFLHLPNLEPPRAHVHPSKRCGASERPQGDSQLARWTPRPCIQEIARAQFAKAKALADGIRRRFHAKVKSVFIFKPERGYPIHDNADVVQDATA
jgi:hypothetical protein